eukprot:TRINITY_DN13440_c0_g1_i2.p1 TRINITY_DN13440_c0_g1~~TRINITY_DN13440_c0_g1_i2.p1  ORF type:complete len:735 (+),score=186.18 TRINITY_DN13440_c0_g1_i2:105-2309(+)
MLMRNALALALLAALAVSGSRAHQCVHEEMAAVVNLQPMEFTAVEEQEWDAAEWKPLRIRYDMTNLEPGSNKRTCFKSGQKAFVGSNPVTDAPMCGGEVSRDCWRVCKDYDVLTPKRAKIIKDLLAVVKDELEGYLKVKRRDQKFRAMSCLGGQFTEASIAQKDMDLLISVNAAMGEAGSAAAAWAAACHTGSVDNRPIQGVVNFMAPKLDGVGVSKAQLIETTRHEISHILGVSGSLMRYFMGYGGRKSLPQSRIFTTMADGSKALATPRVVSFVREHFQCADACGAPLENNGGSGTVGSHWELSVFYGEYMVGASYAGSQNTRLTGALFEDSGWYQVDRSKENPLAFGKGAGCDFLKGCSGYPDEYKCSGVPDNAKSCAFDGVGESRCHQGMDVRMQAGCYFRSPLDWNQCNQGSTPDHKKDDVRKSGIVYSPKSFCFSGDAQLAKYGKQSFSTPHCYEASCDTSGDKPRVKVSIRGKSYTCPEDQLKSFTPTGFTGELYCPSPRAVCPTAVKKCSADCASIHGACVDGKCICPPGYQGDASKCQVSSKCGPKPIKRQPAPQPRNGQCISVWKAKPLDRRDGHQGPCTAKNFCQHNVAVVVNCRLDGNQQAVTLGPGQSRVIRCADGVPNSDLLVQESGDTWITPSSEHDVDEDTEDLTSDSYLGVDGQKKRKKKKKRRRKNSSSTPASTTTSTTTTRSSTRSCPSNPDSKPGDADSCYCNTCAKVSEYKCE